MMNAWIIAVDDRRLGGLVSTSRALSDRVAIVAIGTEALADRCARIGADEVLFVERQEDVPAEAYACAVASHAEGSKLDYVLSNDNPAARIILGRVAHTVGVPVVSEVKTASAQGDATAVFERSVANGKALECLSVTGGAAAIFIGDDVEPAAKTCPIETLEAQAGAARVESVDAPEGGAITSAQRIVGVGMGLGSRASLPIAEDLAQALDAQVACTLPCCNDMHWFGPERVIGSSHSTVAPDLYIALGISGSPNHMSGARDSKVIVAVNSDPKAEIFSRVDYGIVGDVHEITPALTEALE